MSILHDGDVDEEGDNDKPTSIDRGSVTCLVPFTHLSVRVAVNYVSSATIVTCV